MTSVSPKPSGLRRVPWLVSFGDLLTLLLCFFVLIIAQSPINPRSTAAVERLTSSSDVEKAVSDPTISVNADAGIGFANLVLDGTESELAFGDKDFVGIPEALSSAAVERLKRDLVLDGYRVHDASITSCAADHRAGAETLWFAAMGRALEMRRQLVDAGVAAEGIGLEVRGPHCPESTTGTTRVELKFSKVTHG